MLLYLRRHWTHRLQQTMASMVGTIAPTPLTSEWLAAHGCDVEDGEDVDGEEPMEAGENGSISRVALRRRGGETRTLVAKRPPTSPAALSVAATQQWYARELFFYEALAGRLDATTIRAPRRAASALSAATGDFCLVLEDLAASGCRPFRAATSRGTLPCALHLLQELRGVLGPAGILHW